jgi:type II secretory pathway predicted ATPase ExeA
MNKKRLLALFGLKWNPFLPNIPVQSLWVSPGMDTFLFQIENLVMDGGFALMSGEPGLGKSKNLQYLAHKLERLENVVVGVMQRPQSSLADFYREMGDLFAVNLTPANRYGGFKALRERWRQHIKSTLFRPILLVDEAQEMLTTNLNELRLLGSAEFDSECLLTVILCGDLTLPERFRSNGLLALGSRIRFRRMLSPYDKKELRSYLEYALEQAGAPQLMTKPLISALVEHSAGNLRLLNVMAAELLTVGAQKELAQLDEQLFLELYSPTPQKKQPR